MNGNSPREQAQYLMDMRIRIWALDRIHKSDSLRLSPHVEAKLESMRLEYTTLLRQAGGSVKRHFNALKQQYLQAGGK